MLKKLLVLFLISFLLVSCALFPEDDKKEKSSTGSMVIEIPEISRSVLTQISDYTVVIKSTALEYSHTMTTTPGNSITLDKLLPGDYTIDVIGTDSSKIEIVNGTANAAVTVGNTTNVKVELVFSKGDLSIELILPSDGSQTPSGPKRVKRNGCNIYTYDADGLIVKVDYKSQWNNSYEVFTTGTNPADSTQKIRISSKLYVTSAGETTSVEYDGAITHSGGKETEFLYTKTSDGSKHARIKIDYTASGRTETYYNFVDSSGVITENIKYIKIYDTIGRLISEEYTSGEFWSWYFGYLVPTNSKVKGVYTYFEDIYKRTSEVVYVDDIKVCETKISVKAPGIYQYGVTRDAKNGFVINELHFSDLTLFEDKYLQTMTITNVGRTPADVPYLSYIRDERQVRTWTEVYSKDFEGLGSMAHPVEFEDGTEAPGQISVNVFN